MVEVLPSRTRKVVMGCGNVYITIDDRGDTDNRPWRVFLKRGKVGSCQRALLETVGRLVTIHLQDGKPPERLRRTLRGISCEKGTVRRISCMNELARMLAENTEEDEITS
ncbi:MAG: TSCPD domain-containing protein [candidate division Zixibacteria bacterium]|nr:TSCPD domain-containing protein [candidate division Zixibacteria bacterium]